MKNYKSSSNTKPVEWDLTSSPTTVYHNTNIIEVENEEEIMYEYDVTHYTIYEYQQMLNTQLETSVADLTFNSEILNHEKDVTLAELDFRLIMGGL